MRDFGLRPPMIYGFRTITLWPLRVIRDPPHTAARDPGAPTTSSAIGRPPPPHVRASGPATALARTPGRRLHRTRWCRSPGCSAGLRRRSTSTRGGIDMKKTKPRSGTGRPERAGAAANPICRRLFDLQQAADFAGVPVRVICHWIRMGKLEAYHLGGGRVRIDEVELADRISSLNSDRSHRHGRTDRVPFASA
jgi:hypothetical protein